MTATTLNGHAAQKPTSLARDGKPRIDLPPGYGVVSHPDHMYPVIYWLADEIAKVDQPYQMGGTISVPMITGRRVIEASKLGDFPNLLGLSPNLKAEIEADLLKRGIYETA